jgi:glycosyltransferase involved in cell wall biosynthesis
VKELTFAVPGDLATPTGGYGYDRRILAELTGLGWLPQVIDLGEGFPFPTPSVRKAACARLAALPGGGLIVVDGLAFGVLPDMADALHETHSLIALVHHPLAHETGLSAHDAETLRTSERAALSFVRGVIATSEATARLLVDAYGVAAERVHVVHPGADRVSISERREGVVPTILSVGSVVPRKGYDVLIEAVAMLKDLAWRLVIVGDRTRSAETGQELDAAIARHRLGERISFTGAVAPERLDALYADADLFVLASRFEGYGMAYAEAIAHGLPVIGTTAGAIPEAVPAGAGVLVAPDDVKALASALRRLLENPSARAKLAEGAQAAAVRLPTWAEQGARFAHALDLWR